MRRTDHCCSQSGRRTTNSTTVRRAACSRMSEADAPPDFVFWVTGLELFTMISSAVLFARGVRGAAPYDAWRTDGFVISLFAM